MRYVAGELLVRAGTRERQMIERERGPRVRDTKGLTNQEGETDRGESVWKLCTENRNQNNEMLESGENRQS